MSRHQDYTRYFQYVECDCCEKKIEIDDKEFDSVTFEERASKMVVCGECQPEHEAMERAEGFDPKYISIDQYPEKFKDGEEDMTPDYDD